MRRREFITLLGGAAAAWPLAAGAQQPKVPVIGYLGGGSAAASAQTVAVFRQSLAEAGYVVGRNAAIEYRFAEGQYDRLPAMAAELVRSEVALIVAAGGTAPALAAKAATATIPIVFGVTDDPVALGLVVSFARPGGNATGINFPLAELAAKELGLLHELVPAARRIGLLVNPNNSPSAAVTKDVTDAASALGIEIGVVEANNGRAIEAAFASLVRSRSEALLIGTDPFFFRDFMSHHHSPPGLPYHYSNIEVQTRFLMDMLTRQLEANDTDWAHCHHARVYLIEPRRDYRGFMRVWRECFPDPEKSPALAFVPSTGIMFDGPLIEIDPSCVAK